MVASCVQGGYFAGKGIAQGLLRRCRTPQVCSLLVLLLILCCHASVSAGMLLQHQLTYKVVNGDTLRTIGAKLGVDWKKIAVENGLEPASSLKAGLTLRITVSEIIPETIETGILIDVPGRMLFLFDRGIPFMTVPVGLGMPRKEGRKRGWETPEGKFTIKGKLKSPDWKVPESIQEEMRREGRAVKESYPPGPKNPVGGYVLQTTLPGILIHDTIDPSSLHRFMSHGCVRLLRRDMEQLFENVTTGMAGKILYRPIKIAQVKDGRIFMEVNKDAYKKIADMETEARSLLSKSGLLRKVDKDKVKRAVEEATGIPEDVTAVR